MKNTQKFLFPALFVCGFTFGQTKFSDFIVSYSVNPQIQYINHTRSDADSFYTNFRDIDDYLHDSKRRPLAEVYLEKQYQNGWSISAELGVRLSWLKMEETLRTPERVKDINYHFNRRGYIQKEGGNYRVKFGRDYLIWDADRTGTILSDNMPPLDHLRFDIWGDRWLYHSFIIDADTREVIPNAGGYEKNIVGHRVEFTIGNYWKLIAGEMVSISRRLTLAELNPFLLLYHNREPAASTHNVITMVGVQKQLLNGATIFAQLDIDEMDTDKIDLEWRKDVNNTRPFVHGFQTGFASKKFSAVYTQTSPHLYQHYSDNNADFVLVYSRPMDGNKYFNRFMGYPLGGGVKSVELIVGKKHSRSVQYRWVEQTPNAFFVDNSIGGINARHRLVLEWEKPLKHNLLFFTNAVLEHHSNYRFNGNDRIVTEALIGVVWEWRNGDMEIGR